MILSESIVRVVRKGSGRGGGGTAAPTNFAAVANSDLELLQLERGCTPERSTNKCRSSPGQRVTLNLCFVQTTRLKSLMSRSRETNYYVDGSNLKIPQF